MSGTYSERVAALNDEFRRSIHDWNADAIAVAGAGFDAMPLAWQLRAVEAVAHFETFNERNDPLGEHGTIAIPMTVEGVTMLWKIDYFDKRMGDPSPDPSDADATTRILTLMLPEDN